VGETEFVFFFTKGRLLFFLKINLVLKYQNQFKSVKNGTNFPITKIIVNVE